MALVSESSSREGFGAGLVLPILLSCSLIVTAIVVATGSALAQNKPGFLRVTPAEHWQTPEGPVRTTRIDASKSFWVEVPH